MQSDKSDLKKRGLIEPSDVNAHMDLSKQELFTLLHDGSAANRTCAVRLLSLKYKMDEEIAEHLLKALVLENALYTRIEICTCLETGNVSTAMEMIKYLGKIGKNQYKTIPDGPSKKISYPLPRDIIARTLSKMYPSILDIMFEVLKKGSELQIAEILDAIGYMLFYNPSLVDIAHFEALKETIHIYQKQELILYKCVLCLSSFPMRESYDLLTEIHSKSDNGVIQMECERSMAMIRKKGINSL